MRVTPDSARIGPRSRQMESRKESWFSKYRPVIARDFKVIMTIVFLALSFFAIEMIFYNSEAEISAITGRPKESKYGIALEGNKATGISDKGQIVWQIQSDLVTVFQNEIEYEFMKAEANFFDDRGPNLRMEVGKILYNDRDKNMTLYGGLKILTRDNMIVETDRVHWVHYVNQFVFPEKVTLVTSEGNWISADYMQGDKDLRYLSFVGNCQLKVVELTDTKVIEERKLTQADLKLEDFKNVFVHSDMVIYDRNEEVLVAVSDYSDKEFQVRPPLVVNPITGERVMPPEKDEDTQLYFKKGEIELWSNHIEVHMKESWAKCYGKIYMRVNPSEPKPNEDPALKSMKKRVTVIEANDIEYFWDIDYARTYGRSIVAQEGRRAGAEGLTYFGKYEDPDTGQIRKVVFLDDDIYIYQLSGEWLKEDEVIKEIKNPDVEKMLYEEIKLTAGRAVVFLDSNDIFAETNVRIRQRDKAATCGEAFYDESMKKFLCQMGVEYWNKKDEYFTGDQIIFFTDKDDIEVNGKADAQIRIPKKYISEFDLVDRKVKERGAKGTSEEERTKQQLEDLKKFRDENPPWEFLPDWKEVVVQPMPGKDVMRPVPEPPAPIFDPAEFDWIQRLFGKNLRVSPWESGDLPSKPPQPGVIQHGADGLVPPDGMPILPPQITGIEGEEAVRKALGLTEDAGRLRPPAGGEFVPPLPGAQGVKPAEVQSYSGALELEFQLKGDGGQASAGKRLPGKTPQDDSEKDEDKEGQKGEAIIVKPREDTD